MTGTFTIDVDSKRNVVAITMSGFFDADGVAAFVVARNAAHAALTSAPNQHLTINDITEMKVQSQDMVAAFQSVLSDPRHRSRRLAFIVSRSLARMQVMRALDGRNAKCFESRAAAEAWLFAGDDQAVAA